MEVYDLDDASNPPCSRTSHARHVLTANNVMIGGLIIGGNSPVHIVVRGIGPSLAASGITDSLQDPTLELRNADGVLLFSNDNWTDGSSQSAELTSLGLAPTNAKESAISVNLSAGLYTAIVHGKADTTGVALVEIYQTP